LEVRDKGIGRIYADGLLPTEGSANLRLDIDNFPVSNIVDISQTDIDATGILSVHGRMTGTLGAPVFHGAFGLVNGTYNTAVLPDVRGTFDYKNEALSAHADAVRHSGESITTADAQLPINLALTGVEGDRLLPRPMSVDISGDSIPIDLIPQVTDLVSDVHGHAAGKIALRGTLRQPSIRGALLVEHGTMTLTTTGATIESIGASLRMANDTVYVDSLAGWSKGPLRVTGTLAIGNWREPSLDVRLVSSSAELLNNQYGKLRVDASVALTGPFRTARLTGVVTITQGVIYAPEPQGRHVIGAGDPALFNVIDTAIKSDRDLVPTPSPFLANMRMDFTVDVRRNTWVRNREANVEIYTDNPLTVHAEQQAFEVTGEVTTDRGQYEFLSRRFEIKRGSATFIGSPDLNPTLHITGEYEVQTAARGALDIRVSVGGTLRKPSLALESDAQPPRTQSELLSLLAFGQSTTSLLGSASSSIVGSTGPGELFGVGAQYAVRRLAGVALGVAVDQVELQAGRAFGTDVFDITPGDVPSGNFVGNLLTQTKVEAGKYVNPRTFVSVQTQASRLGAGVEHRTADGWQFSASVGPRILLLEPELNSQPFRVMQSYGGFVLRDWRF
ncbi:MAG: translocation/assembly module TamB domain-containing protein, partial [Gemmatimonadaceae bacterium]